MIAIGLTLLAGLSVAAIGLIIVILALAIIAAMFDDNWGAAMTLGVLLVIFISVTFIGGGIVMGETL